MGETPEATGSAGDAIDQGLDAALDQIEPQSDAAPAPEAVEEEETQEVEQSEETVEDTQKEEEQTQIDPRVAPVIQRFKDGTASDNDIDMLTRWRDRADKAKELQSQLDEMSTSDEGAKLIEKLASEHPGGTDFLKEHGLAETFERILAVRSGEEPQASEAAPPAKAPAVDSSVRELAERLDRIEAEKQETLFNKEVDDTLADIAGATGVVKDYIKREIRRTAYLADPEQSVGQFAQEVADEVLGLMSSAKSEGKAETIKEGKKKAAAARPGAAPAVQPEKPKDEPLKHVPLDKRLGDGLEDAISRAYDGLNAT